MSERSGFPTQERQPDPQPPRTPAIAPPLSLYSVLVTISIVMIVIAFSIDEPDWPGLLVNLASGLIGAVVILVIVEQRLRASEVQAIQDYTSTLLVFLASIFSGEVRVTISYARVLSRQLRKTRPNPYLARPALEGLFDHYRRGFILYGEPTLGKSTLVQSIASRQAEAVLRHPKKAAVPIFLPMRHWIEGDLSEQLWEEVREYSQVPRRVFLEWLARGQVVVILDGLDEHWKPERALAEISNFRKRNPTTALIITSRSIVGSPLGCSLEALDNLGLPKIEMPELTTEEAENLRSLKKF